jgi:malyl-CoA/(S)-citramalyl-CoA lyase
MPDGTGAVMIDGKMQDDATWKQAKVIADLAQLVAEKDQRQQPL